MAIHQTTSQSDHESRYHYDNTLCGTGYAQLDTMADAWYKGAWCNPATLSIVLYAEGDLTEYQTDTTEEFCSMLRDYDRYYSDQCGYRWGARIDPGLDNGLTQAFINLGLSDLLYPCYR